MFLLQYGLNVKVGEKTRLDSTLTVYIDKIRLKNNGIKARLDSILTV